MVSKQEEENKLALIPKSEKYIEYMLDVMIKLPRTEKFSIGTEYKQSMYKMLEEIMLLNKDIMKTILQKILESKNSTINIDKKYYIY